MKSVLIVSLPDNELKRDNLNRRLFRQAIKLHGPLNADASYRFVPAIPSGGLEKATAARKSNTLAYLAMLS